MRRLLERRQTLRIARQAPQHQRWFERNRTETVDGQADRLAASGARGHDGDAGCETAEGVAQLATIKGRHGVVGKRIHVGIFLEKQACDFPLDDLRFVVAEQNGRASRRERGCSYVYIWRDDGSLKKKN